MKWWKRLLLRLKPPRELELTLSGRWYLALTIAMGVVALVSGNNVLYLIESLLLSALIFSGVLSERMIAALEVRVRRHPAIAAQASSDLIEITHHRGYPVFCVAIEELLEDGSTRLLAYLSRLAPRARVVLPSVQRFEQRGEVRVLGVRVVTSYPFGFATKILTHYRTEHRLIWPERIGRARLGTLANRRLELEPADGELKQWRLGDDPRWIVWSRSAQGGPPIVRPRKRGGEAALATLDLTLPAGEKFEAAVVAAAALCYAHPRATLVLEGRERQVVHGSRAALDRLSCVRPEASG